MTQEERFQRLTSTEGLRQDLRGRSVRAAIFTGLSGFGDFFIRLGSTAVLARLIIPEHFGLVMMVTAVTAIADQLKELGLSSATVQQKEITHAEVTNLFWLNVAISSTLAAIVCVLSPVIARYYHEPRLIAITCALASNFVFGGLMVQHQALLTRQLKLGHTSTIRLVTSVVSTALAILLAWMDFGYWSLVWREVARSLMLAGGMWLCFPWIPGLPSTKTSIRKLVGFGANLTAANIVGSISAGIDRFLLGRFWGPAPVAMYRQAYQLMSAPTDQLISPIYQVTQPALSLLQNDPERYRLFYRKVVAMVCLMTMPLSLFTAVFAHEITLGFLGPRWVDSAPLLQILSFGTFIKQAVGSAAFVLITRGHSKTYLLLTLTQNATLILFMSIGVHWGAIGIAVADIATTYVLIAPRLYFSFKGSPVSIGQFFATIAPPVLSSVVMALALSGVRVALSAHSMLWSVIIGLPVALVTFFGTWALIPGGATDLKAIVGDVRSALQRKVLGTKATSAPAAAT